MNSSQRPNFFNSIPPVTRNIIIINIIAWFATIVFLRINIDLNYLLGLHYFGAENFRFYQMLTYMFLHDTSSLSHLFFNMFAVFMFGRSIEMTWGSKRYLMYYLITGIGAGLVQELIWFINLSDLIGSGYESVSYNGATIPVASFINEFVTIGASGAVFGILLAFGALYPNAELFIMFIPIPVKAKYFVVVYGLIELFLGIRNSGGDNVAHFAHLGGMLFGLIMVLYWKQKDKKNVNHFF